MNKSIIKQLALFTLIAIIALPSALATDSNKRPNKRQKRVYTSREEIEARQDSVNNAMVAPIQQPEVATTTKPEQEVMRRHINTPQQIDSVVAMWRTLSTQEHYNRYFDECVAAASRIDEELGTSNMDSIYIARLEALMSPVPLKYNYEVRRAIERFTSQGYATTMGYAYYYFPMIEEELIKAGLPIELRTLAFVESTLNPTATSKAGAKGIWQFMPSTGKMYGLEINSLVDERCNPILATRAACKYLKSMYELYGDWTLAIASYNTGPNNVNKAIVRAGGDVGNFEGSFWDVYEYLYTETRAYVPLYIGATYAFAYHKHHNIEIATPPMPLAVDTVMISRPMHLEQISSTINVDLELLKMLNPQYTLAIIPATTKQYSLTLPTECISDYVANEAAIHAKDSTYLKEYVVQANLEKKRAEAPAAQYHIVKKGDTLGGIARKYGCTVKQLISWNKLKNPDALSIGQKIRVSAP